MPRLSVSVNQEQADWIEAQQAEFGFSKARIVRECIDAARGGDSVFTKPVHGADSRDDDQFEKVLRRLDEIEETIREVPGTAQADINIITDQGGRVRAGSAASGARDTADQPPDLAADRPDVSEGARNEGDAAPMTGDPQDQPTNEAPGQQSDPDSRASSGPGDGGGDPNDAEATTPTTDSGESGTENIASDPRTHETAPAEPAELNDEMDPSGSADPATEADEGPPGIEASSGSTDARATEGNTSTEPSGAPSLDVEKADPDAVRKRLEDVSDNLDRATAIFACWERLRDRGTVHKRAFQALYEDYPLDHTDEREWWRESIEPVLLQLPGVQAPEGDGRLYRFKY